MSGNRRSGAAAPGLALALLAVPVPFVPWIPVALIAGAGLLGHVLATAGPRSAAGARRSRRHRLTALARSAARAALPAALFLAVLLLLDLGDGSLRPLLLLRTAAMLLATTAAWRFIDWRRVAQRLRPGNPAYLPLLYLLVTRHLAAILLQEARRVLLARSLALPRRHGAGALPSLRHAVAAILVRALVRAERFYAAQSLNGLG